MTSLLVDDFVQRAYLPNLHLSHHRFREQGLGLLSPEQIEQFDEHGYVVIKGFLTGRDINELNADIEPAVKYAEEIENKNLARRNKNSGLNLLLGPSNPERKSSPFYRCPSGLRRCVRPRCGGNRTAGSAKGSWPGPSAPRSSRR